MNSKNYKSQIEKIVLKNLNPLVETIESMDVLVIFDIVDEILSNFKVESSIMLKIVKLSSLRILKEIKSSSIKNKKHDGHNIVITKCFLLLRNLCSKEEFLEEYLTEIEICLEPIFSYMKSPSSINFEDEIFDIMRKILTATKSPTLLANLLFPNLILFYKKCGTINQEFFELISCYLNYANGLVNSNEHFCQLVIPNII